MVVGLFYLLCFLLLGLGVNGENSGSSERLKSHPFLSDTCVNLITADLTTPPTFPKHDIYIVLPLYNPNDPQLVVQAVKSILSDAKTNYEPYNINLKNLIIVDDNSDSSISGWTVWKSFTENELKILKFLRYSLHQGKVKAKNGAVRYLRDKYSIQGDSALLVFMDVPSVASPRWLFPLTLTLNKYEKALVYPSFNIISTLQPSDAHYVEGGVNYVVAKGGDLVASFDWDFTPRWESIHDSNRLKHTSTNEGTPSSIEWVSPTIPLVFAVSWNHFHFLDKFDETLFESSFFVHENIDLSLRNWLCEGIIIQQTCSQIAVAYDYSTNKDFTPAALGPKITKDHIDQNIINLALRYFSINIPEKMKQNFIENHKKSSNEDQSKTEEREYVLQKILEKFYQEKKLREISYEKRFLHRIDGIVSSDIDPVRTGPYQSFSHHTNLPSAICNDFDWFLDEVYPGLYQDGAKVMTEYVAFHDDETHYHQLLQKTFTPIIQSFKQAYQEKYIANILPQSNALTAAQKEEKKFIQDRENTLRRYGPYFLESSSVQANKLSDESAAAPALKHHFDEPVYVKKYHGYTYEELMEQVSMKNREHLQCIDFQDPTSEKFCETTTLNGDPHACQQRKPKVLFACPKMCGFCDRDQENKFCEDFYLMKCPVWKQQGMCGKTDGQFGSITDICRKSCGICVPDYMKSEPLVVKSENKQENNNQKSDQNRIQQPIVIKREDHPVVKPQPPAVPGGGGDPNDPNSLNAIDVNEKIAHEQYLSDQIPDVFATVNNDVCHLNDRSDGQLLSRIKVHEEYNPLHPSYSIANKVRLFCGIYTLKKSHQTNVKATRNTWAKKCDGFIAFSDERDESIPSINIHHEGLEEYDNMWQKSRSIWKLLAKSFISSYDFFLLGGDDMFYIIENLRYYLSSPEIMKAREERNGLYIGRIFQPPKQVVFNSGGAGYLLDTKALKVLGDNIDTPKCWPHQRGFWEDVNVANCLKLSTENITPYQTRDSYQRERFHPFNPGLQLTYRVPPNPDWYAKYNPDLKIGYECCSEDSISFHYIPEKKLYQLHNYLYHCEHKAKD